MHIKTRAANPLLQIVVHRRSHLRSLGLTLRYLIKDCKSLRRNPCLYISAAVISYVDFNELFISVGIPTISLHHAQLHLVLGPQFMFPIKRPEFQVIDLNMLKHAHLTLVSNPNHTQSTPPPQNTHYTHINTQLLPIMKIN